MDNEREEIDRGFSGRFSSNMGFKYDFDKYEGEEFNYSETSNMNSSILRFKKEPDSAPVLQIEDY